MPPKKGGMRCVVGNCCNSAYGSEYSVYSIQRVKEENTKKKWLDFVSKSRQNFDSKHAKTVYICDGHFLEGDFCSSHVMMYRTGHRKKAPELVANAVPSLLKSRPPHFQTRVSDPSLQQQKWEEKFMEVDPISRTSTLDESPKKKRRRSRYSIQKEAGEIAKEYEEPVILHTADDCQIVGCLENHAMRIQTDEVILQHQQTQADVYLAQPPSSKKPKKCHKSQQFRYKGPSVAIQTEAAEVPRLCQCQCATPPPLMKNQAVQYEEQEVDGEEEEEEEEEVEADDPKDKDWEPPADLSDDDDDDSDCEDEYIDEEVPPHEDRKYIVFEHQLMDLMKYCPSRNCGAPCTLRRSTARCHGSMLVVSISCTICPYSRKWRSQPMIGNLPAGNLLLSSSILYSSSNPTKVIRMLNHLNVQGITNNTYLNHQRFYLQPAIVEQWRAEQKKIFADLRAKGEPLILAGDARCDSPGRCAKFGTYTLMDMKSGLVIDVQTITKTTVANSNAMELEGLKAGLAFIYAEGLTVSTLITDRHVQIPKFLRENYPDIVHKYDAWHISKSVKKQLFAVSKLKHCEEVGLWLKSVVNHLYWAAASTPDGDGDLIAAKFLSVINHIRNKHTGHSDHADFTECAHGDLEPREWLTEDSRSYDKICEVVTKPYLVKCIKKISPMEQTSSVEAFHGVICMWAPKLLAYSNQGQVCRTFLAVLHWNENGNRDQGSTQEGNLQFSICYPKQSAGGYAVKKVLTACTYGYAGQLIQRAVKLGENGDKDLRLTMPDLKAMATMASKHDRPNKADAVQAHLDRGQLFGGN